MKIIWYGHSCFRLETGSSVILIDPFLKGNPTFEQSGIAWDEATKGVTHVALTHGHSDHAGDAGEICKKRGATLFANFELAMYMKTKGAERLEPMNTGGTVAVRRFRTHARQRAAFLLAGCLSRQSQRHHHPRPRTARRSITWATRTCSAAWP